MPRPFVAFFWTASLPGRQEAESGDLPDTAWAVPFVLRTAAAVPDRIGAGATFHGGGLVNRQAR